MYIFDFIKRAFRKTNIPTIIYLILNVLLIGAIIHLFYGYGEGITYGRSCLYGLVAYLISLIIALSPIGEWLLRLQTGCRRIKNQKLYDYIMPIFNEVYDRARKEDPSIPEDVTLFVSNNRSPNAFATGRKTVCITTGFLNLPEYQIKAALGHEFGHLAHKDTDMLLVVLVGNGIVTTLVTVLRLIIIAIEFIFDLFSRTGILSMFVSMLSIVFVDGFMFVWSWLGTALVLKTGRDNEFEADAFSFRLGYGDGLVAFFSSIGADRGRRGVFATLYSSHPASQDRIARLCAMGATYREPTVEEKKQIAQVMAPPKRRTLTPQKVFCRQCGQLAKHPQASFCEKCGARLVK